MREKIKWILRCWYDRDDAADDILAAIGEWLEPIYQHRLASGKWIDQTEQSYRYNQENGHGDKLRIVFAAPVQQEPEKRLIGWRTENFLLETADQDMAKNLEPNIGVLPIFEGDVNTKLSAPQPAPDVAQLQAELAMQAVAGEYKAAAELAIQAGELLQARIAELERQNESAKGLLAAAVEGLRSNRCTGEMKCTTNNTSNI
jgi:hypothetical protein